MTHEQRRNMAAAIIEAMREAYEEEGEEGDFDSGYLHFVRDASEEELLEEHKKWVKE